MLALLNLKDFVIVENLTVEASPGLTCLTGETGAGKSILIDALQFVLGARSDLTLIREGAQKAEVSAEFTTDERAVAWLKNAQIDADESVLIRRTVDTKGKSHGWINGSSVTASQLRELGETLLDIHGQHASQSLLKPAFQLNLLDGFAGCADLVRAVHDLWEAWQTRRKLLEQAELDREKLQAEADRLSWINEILEELNPQEGEWEEISREHALLSNASDIIQSVKAATRCLTDDEENALALLDAAQSHLSHAGRFDEAYARYAQALGEASSVIADVTRDAVHHLEHCNLDEERLASLDDRLNAYWRLSKKFHRTPEELFTLREQTRKRLGQLQESFDVKALKKAEQEAHTAFRKTAEELTQKRREAACRLSASVTEQMQKLAMQGGSFTADLVPCEAWSGGLEKCEFKVAGHAGTTPRPLSKVASGGELSRISLAVAVITAALTPVGTLIFDEIDSGIGGAVAEVVGHMLRQLARSRQVLCVTHLPQVASCADNQWQVIKHTENGKTASTLRVLSPAERIDEIARMLGGLTITPATRQAAGEMLGMNASLPEI